MTAEAPSAPTGGQKLITIDEILHARPQMPALSSRRRGWDGITVDLHQPYYDCDETYAGLAHHVICYCPSGSSRLVQARAGAVHEGVISAGMSFLMPAGHDSTWRGDSGVSARLRIPPVLVTQAAEESGGRRTRVEIRNIFEISDPVIGHLTEALLAEMNLAPHHAQALIVNSLSVAVAAHMLRRFNAFALNGAEPGATLSAQELALLKCFVEENMDRTITLAELAALVHVSVFHFSRMFKRSTGLTAISYIEKSRVRRAQSLIVATNHPLSEIALMAGFADQSHFTRRFRRHTGYTPAAFASEQGRRRGRRLY